MQKGILGRANNVFNGAEVKATWCPVGTSALLDIKPEGTGSWGSELELEAKRDTVLEIRG